ncbi:hypothetical protein D3C76_1350760 [compost metagenome]
MRFAQRIADHRLQQHAGYAKCCAGNERRRQSQQAQVDNYVVIEVARVKRQKRLHHGRRGNKARTEAQMNDCAHQQQRQKNDGSQTCAHHGFPLLRRNGMKNGLPVIGLTDICTSTSKTVLISSAVQTSPSCSTPSTLPSRKKTSVSP